MAQYLWLDYTTMAQYLWLDYTLCMEIGGGLEYIRALMGLYKLMTQPSPKAMDNQPAVFSCL